MEEETSLFSLSLDPATKDHLSDVARWGKILAIACMVLLVLGMAQGLYSTLQVRSENSDASAGATGTPDGYAAGVVIGYLVVGVILVLPLVFVLRFANGIKRALDGNDQLLLNFSFQQLKICFRYLGIVAILVLILTALSLIITVARNLV